VRRFTGLIGFPLRSGYAASKHAIKGYLETLQCELFKTNITISLVYPRINTNISKNALVGDGKQYGATDENNEVGMDVGFVRKNIKDYAQPKSIIIVKQNEFCSGCGWLPCYVSKFRITRLQNK
jgi:short-subunit dehydrogenase